MPLRGCRDSSAEIYQSPVALGNHGRHNGFGDKECGVQLSVQLATELFPGQIGERRDVIGDQRVVHQHVDRSPPLFGLADHRRTSSATVSLPGSRSLTAGRGNGATTSSASSALDR